MIHYKNKLVIVLTLILLLSKGVAAQTTVTYQPSNSIFPNPERGFFFSIDPPHIIPEEWTRALQSSDIQYAKENGMTLIAMRYHLANFRDKPLSQQFLDRLTVDCQMARQAGIKLIVRFAYAWVGIDRPDASKDIILQHLDQLKPFFDANYDVIAYFDTGFVGSWGQWNKSSNNLVDNYTLGLKPESKQIIARILDVVPPSRMIAMSYSRNKREYLNTLEPTPLSEAYTPTARARMGFTNDGLLNGDSDLGYYDVNFPPYDGTSSITADKLYHERDTRYVLMTGEMAIFSDTKVSYYSCESTKASMARFHYRTLNINGEGSNIAFNAWKAQGCMDEIKNRLGYRFRLLNASIPSTSNAGSNLEMNFQITNDGFGGLYNPRLVEIILRNNSSGLLYRFNLNTDSRAWQPNEINSIPCNITLPPTMPSGEYSVLLNFPDPSTSLYNRPEYSIRLANENVWESTTGFNSLLHKIKIVSSPEPDASLRTPENPSNTINGLEYNYFEGTWDKLPDFGSLTAVKKGNVNSFDLSVRNKNDYFGFTFTGYINIPSDGEYTFYTSSDDGSKLYIGNTQVVNNDGLHGVKEASGKIGLKKGKHAITVTFFEKAGGENLAVSYSGGGLSKQSIPSTSLYRLPTGFAGYYKLTAKHSGKSLDVYKGTKNDGDSIIQSTYGGGDNQIWEIVDVEGGYYKLLAKHSGKALDVTNANTVNGAKIQQYYDNSTDAQKWKIEDVGDGYYTLTNKASNKVLDVSKASQIDGAGVLQWEYYGSDNQKWKIELISASESVARYETLNDAKVLLVFPNPASKQLTIIGQENIKEIRIVNTLGIVSFIKRNIRTQEVRFNLDLPTGVYLLQAETEKGKKLTRRLIVQ